MYRIELARGEETVFRTFEELATAVHNGVVTARARIYHTASEKWLPIEFHPHYKRALESPPPPRVPVPAPAPRSRELAFVGLRTPAPKTLTQKPAVQSLVAVSSLEQLSLKLPRAVRSPVVDLPKIEYPSAPSVATAEPEPAPAPVAVTAVEPTPVEPAPVTPAPVALTTAPASQPTDLEVPAEDPEELEVPAEDPEELEVPAEEPEDPDAPVIELPVFERPKFHPPLFVPPTASPDGDASTAGYGVLEPATAVMDEPAIERLPRPAWRPRPLRLVLAGAALAIGAYVAVSAFSPERGHASTTAVERPQMPTTEPASSPDTAPAPAPAVRSPAPTPSPAPAPAPRPTSSAQAPVSGPPVGFSLAAPPLETPRAEPARDSVVSVPSIDPAPAAIELDLPAVPRGESLVKSTTPAKDSAAMKRILRAVTEGK
jgi:hypothetical protein